jgi:hypothetical protein
MTTQLAASGQHRRLRILGALLAALLALAALVPAANAATGPRPLAPVQGKVFDTGAFVTFKVKDASAAARRYGIFMVIANRRVVRHGQLQQSKKGKPGFFAQMKRRKHGVYTYTPPISYAFPGWFMVTPTVYYWQAHHIDCGASATGNCYVVGGIRHFRVR